MPNLFFVTFVSSSWLELLANYFFNLYSSLIWPKMDNRKVTVNQILISVTQHCEMGLSLWIFHTFSVDCCDWTMDNTQVSYRKKELFALREHMGSAPVFGRVRVTHRFNFLCFAFCLVCFRPVSCVSNITSVSWLSILDCPFGFLQWLSKQSVSSLWRE